jgi:hypothetical protein
MPAAMATTPLLSPTTSCGVLTSSLFPVPNWLLPFCPQHFTEPMTVNAHV